MSFTLTYRTADPAHQAELQAFIDDWNSGQPTFTVSTSGSTGAPKTIVLERFQLLASARRTLRFFGLEKGAKAIVGLSPRTIGGKMMLVRALEGELDLTVCAPSANPLLTLEPGEQFDFCPLVPLQLQTIGNTQPERLQQVRTILLGGAPVPAALETEITALHPAVYMGYGMTETVSHVAVRPLGTPVYTAMEGVSFGEQNGQLVINDTHLQIAGLKTTDSVHLLDDTHFEWLGRADFAINSGGIKIHPEQLEQALTPYISGTFFITSRPHVTFGEECILIAEPNATLPELDFVQAICRERFGKYAVPKALIRSEMVWSNGAKINRNATKNAIGIHS